jgi:hypothetical protein
VNVFDQKVALAQEGDEAVANLVLLVDDGSPNIGHHSLGDAGDYIGVQSSAPILAIISSDRAGPISGQYARRVRLVPRVTTITAAAYSITVMRPLYRGSHALAGRRLVALLGTIVLAACGSAAPNPIGTSLNAYQLKFKVMDAVGTPVYCDPDMYPVAREGGELASAISQYPAIRAQAEMYAAIVAHEHLPSGDLADSQKVTVYRAYKLLNALALTPNGNEHAFDFRAQPKGESTIQLVQGTVRVDGVVTVTSQTRSGPPPCPICLAASTLIATPDGAVRVVDMKPGMLVWTAAADGKRIAVAVLEVGSTPVPAGHMMVLLVLADSRQLLASPGHRTADGRTLGSLSAGDALDGSTVRLWELVPYSGDHTYDLLPAGATGTYWANGILLSSTLSGS